MSERLIEALENMKEARYRACCYASYSASAASAAAYYTAASTAAYVARYTEPEKVKEIILELLCQRD